MPSIMPSTTPSTTPAVLETFPGMFFAPQGKLEEAEKLFEQSMAIDINIYGKDHPEVATDLSNLADLKQEQARVMDPLNHALKHFLNHALNHPPLCLRSLLECSSQGKLEEAETLYKKSLAIRIKIFGKNHPKVATVLNNLASLKRQQARVWWSCPINLVLKHAPGRF